MNNFVEIHMDEYFDNLPPNYFNFSYELDHFQLHGCKAIANNDNFSDPCVKIYKKLQVILYY